MTVGFIRRIYVWCVMALMVRGVDGGVYYSPTSVAGVLV